MNKKTFFILLTTAGILIIGSILFLGKKTEGGSVPYQLEVPSSQLKVNLAAAASTAQVAVEKGSTKISFETPLEGASLKKEKDEYVYKDKKGLMEIRYRPIPKGVKEEIVLNQQVQTNKFDVKMTLTDAVIEKNLDGQPVIFDKKGNYQFHFQKPYAQDAKGKKTYALSYTWDNPDNSNNLLLTLVVDKAWLSDPKRVYPIMIDPTIIDDEQEAKPEVTSKKTLSSNTYDLGNGKFAQEISAGPVNYYDSVSNSFKEINETIVPSDDPLYNYMVKEGIHQVYFKTDPSTAQTVKFYYDSLRASPNLEEKSPQKTGYTTFQPMSLNFRNDLDQIQQISTVKSVTGAANTNTFSYPNVFGTGLNLNYTYVSTMLREELIINEFSNLPKPEQYILDGKNATLDLDELIDWADNLDIYIDGKPWDKKTTVTTTGQVEFKSGEALLFFIPPAYAWDSSESRNEVLLTHQFKKQGGKLYVIKKTPYSWLATAQYPVAIDPDFAGDTADGYVFGSGWPYAAARATSGGYYTTDDTMEVGQLLEFDVARGFLKFDTSAIGAGATVTQTNLRLVVIYDFSSTDFDVQIVKYDWSGQDPLSAANKEAAYDGCLSAALDDNIWRNTNGMSIQTQYTSGNLATAWVNKIGATYYGLRSSRDSSATEPTGNEYIYLATAEHATASYRPVLIVEYTLPPSPTNDSLTFTNPYTGGGNDAVADNTTEWNFQAVVSHPSGYTNLNTVVLRLANASDNTTPYDSLKFTWTELIDTFSETADTQNAATITSTDSDSSCADNTCTLDFKIKFNNNFSTQSTNYNAELYTTADDEETDEDTYTNFYQVIPVPAMKFEGVKMEGIKIE